MSVDWGALGPMIDITADDGTDRRLMLEVDDDGIPVQISEQPDEGFPPPITLGAPEQNSDIRTRKTVWKDWRRGMGRDEYDETSGIAEFRDSQCDTRFPNVLVCRPLPVRLGSSTTALANAFSRFVYIGPTTSTARWFNYGAGTAKYYSNTTSQWVATGLTNGSSYFTRGPGGLYHIHGTWSLLSQSYDGITWNTVDITDLNAMFASATLMYGLVLHDNKLFTMLSTGVAGTLALCQSTDATQTATTANWTQLGSLVLDYEETISQLFVWRFPPDPGRPGIFALTNRRIMFYDDTADAASVTAWKQWHVWDVPFANSAWPEAVVNARTGDLYVNPGIQQDQVWQFTGSTITPHGPNDRGGLPTSRAGAFYRIASNAHGLVGWMTGSPEIGNGNVGMVVALNEQDGWHHILDPGSTATGFPAGASIRGGGVGPTSVITMLDDWTVWEQDFFDSNELPQYAITARNYDTTPLRHITAKTDIGTPTLKKVGLYVEINAKIPTGATIKVLYRADNSDGLLATDDSGNPGAFTSMDTFTASTSMPARIGFGSNVKFRQMELKFILTRGTATSATPILYSAILHTTLVVPVRWVYQVRVDLRRSNVKNIPGAQAGYGITNLRTWVRALHGSIVSFTVAQPTDEITCTRAQVTVTPIEDPSGMGGRYLLQFRDLTTPTSGA